MFKKILIANRGEIAVRIHRACKKMGICSVGIYSEADADAPHVSLVDEAFAIGGKRVQESYLDMEKIFHVAHEAGVDAIHPGYGLLSENARFAERCEKEGFTFIGPSSIVIAAMGSKIDARKTMESAGIPLVPGISHALSDAEEAAAAGSRIGFPVMLKASAGGGGIGMQVVQNEEELRKAFEGNQKRARDFFGDGAMYVEKFIENPRHIEIQLLGDKYGNVLHLWERECSIQRRHQKIIEEAPSPFLDEITRMKMGEAAVKAAKKIQYYNAGTMEFIVDEEQNFYFLEMNTRLQVEHPVTEEITGLDLVEWQIRIAAGEELSFSQEEIKRKGHAIEVRIYAEDPVRFFPSPGQMTALEIPEGADIRHELAVHSHSLVTPFYDPMIAKLIVTGGNREEAIASLSDALSHYKVTGIKTNIPLLQRIVDHEAYRQGDTTTRFITQYM